MVTLSPVIPSPRGNFYPQKSQSPQFSTSKLPSGDEFHSQEKLRFSSNDTPSTSKAKPKRSEQLENAINAKNVRAKFQKKIKDIKASKAAKQKEKAEQAAEKQVKSEKELEEKLKDVQKVKKAVIDITVGTSNPRQRVLLQRAVERAYSEFKRDTSDQEALVMYKRLVNSILPTKDDLINNHNQAFNTLNTIVTGSKKSILQSISAPLRNNPALKNQSDPIQLLSQFSDRLEEMYVNVFYPASAFIKSDVDASLNINNGEWWKSNEVKAARKKAGVII